MSYIANGTVIQIPENEKSNTHLVHVLKRANGLTVSDHRVLMDDLLKALYSMMEPTELTQLILEEENGDYELNQIFDPVFQSQNYEIIFRCLNLVLTKCRSEDDMKMLTVILRSLAERFDISEIDAEGLNDLLLMLLNRVKSIDDEEILLRLYMTLLKRINIASSKREVIGVLLRQLADRMNHERDQDVKRWFKEQITSYMPAHKSMTTPIFPQGTILYQEELSGKKILVLEVEKLQRDIRYYNTPYSAVGHPKLLFEFKLNGKKIVHCNILAMKDEPVKPTSKLYHYPFGNVFSNFNACWPQLDEIEITQLTQLRNLPSLFFRSSTNDHGYSGKNLRELFISLQGNDFDDETLVETGLTVADHFGLISYSEEM